MSGWTKRDSVGAVASMNYSDIWDTDGWQINLCVRPVERPYVLIDTNMPLGVPASSVMACYATLKEAQEAADRFGPMDWSEVQDEEPASPQPLSEEVK